MSCLDGMACRDRDSVYHEVFEGEKPVVGR